MDMKRREHLLLALFIDLEKRMAGTGVRGSFVSAD